jgi:hypothetical protein
MLVKGHVQFVTIFQICCELMFSDSPPNITPIRTLKNYSFSIFFRFLNGVIGIYANTAILCSVQGLNPDVTIKTAMQLLLVFYLVGLKITKKKKCITIILIMLKIQDFADFHQLSTFGALVAV